MSIAWSASTPEMDAIFSVGREVSTWLEFEAALARAEAHHGLIPLEAAADITTHAKVELLDLEQLATDIRFAVHPIMPFVTMFAGVCTPPYGEYVHWGATTQDVLDTGLVLRLRDADTTLRTDLDRLIEALRTRAMEHRSTAMAGRTHGQHAVPITLGYKLAVWVDELQRHRASLDALRPEVLVGQFGGATGTLASLGAVGLEVRTTMMRDLGLGETMITWHVARDRLAHYAFLLSLITSAIQRLAWEIVHLQRDEIAELHEPFHHGKVGSSTMPHKRNPSMSESLFTLGEIAKNEVRTALSGLTSLHERDKAVYSVENDYIPRMCGIAHRMLQQAIIIVEGLQVDRERMAANLAISRGQLFSERVLMALAGHLGRQQAHELLYEASMQAFDEGLHLKDALSRIPSITRIFSPDELDELFDLGELNVAAVEQVRRVCGE